MLITVISALAIVVVVGFSYWLFIRRARKRQTDK
jgi:preprotein translocase subunit YajC